jgi:hypothetical protein
MQGIERRMAILSAREGYIPGIMLVDTNIDADADTEAGWIRLVLHTSGPGNTSASARY